MKPPPFAYTAPASEDEAVAVLHEHGDDAKVLAGGQSLMPLLALRLAHAAHIVDVNRCTDLARIDIGSEVCIGALVREREIERSDAVSAAHPMLAHATSLIGHGAIRNRGTIGGSIAHADPAAELPAVLAAVGGSVDARSQRGTRTLPAEQLFQGFLTTALEPDELLTAVRFPAPAAGTGWSFLEFTRRCGDFAIVAVATTLRVDDRGMIVDAAMAFAGVASTPVRAAAAEAMLLGETPTAALFESAAHQAAGDLDPPSDLHGPATYRRDLAAVLARRSLTEARGRTEDGA